MTQPSIRPQPAAQASDKIVTVIIRAKFHDINPPHVYNPSCEELHEIIKGTLADHYENILYVNAEAKSGLFNKLFYPIKDTDFGIQVREEQETLWQRIKRFYAMFKDPLL